MATKAAQSGSGVAERVASDIKTSLTNASRLAWFRRKAYSGVWSQTSSEYSSGTRASRCSRDPTRHRLSAGRIRSSGTPAQTKVVANVLSNGKPQGTLVPSDSPILPDSKGQNCVWIYYRQTIALCGLSIRHDRADDPKRSSAPRRWL